MVAWASRSSEELQGIGMLVVLQSRSKDTEDLTEEVSKVCFFSDPGLFQSVLAITLDRSDSMKVLLE